MKFRIIYKNLKCRTYVYTYESRKEAIAKCGKLASNPNAYEIVCYPVEEDGHGKTTYYESIYRF